MRLLLAAVAVSVFASLVGCGGGGSSGPVTVSLPGEMNLEGSVWSTNGGPFGGDLVVGDQTDQLGPAQGIRAFVSFDVTGIPVGATVQHATLTIVQRNVASLPYLTLGTVLVDEVVYGGVLDSGAYDRSFPSNQGLGPISTDAVLGAKSLDVTAAVQEDLTASRAHAQFRLRFDVETDSDSESDQAQFWSTGSATTPSDGPVLVVTYVH